MFSEQQVVLSNWSGVDHGGGAGVEVSNAEKWNSKLGPDWKTRVVG